MKEKAIQITNAMTYLGIVVDKDLLSKDHVKKAAEKAHRVLTSLSRLMPVINMWSHRITKEIAVERCQFGSALWCTGLVRNARIYKS